MELSGSSITGKVVPMFDGRGRLVVSTTTGDAACRRRRLNSLMPSERILGALEENQAAVLLTNRWRSLEVREAVIAMAMVGLIDATDVIVIELVDFLVEGPYYFGFVMMLWY